MYEVFETFAQQPTARNYRRVRDAVRHRADYRDDAQQLIELEECCQQGDFAELQRLIEHMLPAWWLSPRLHYYAARAAEALGDEEDAELERFLLQTCLEGLLATGDGSPECPFLVTYSGDSYDILEALGRRAVRQQLVERHNQLCDVITCEDDSELWFDVTDLLAAPARRHRPVLESMSRLLYRAH